MSQPGAQLLSEPFKTLKPSPSPVAPDGRWILKETWLTRRPSHESGLMATIATFSLVLASLVYWQDVGHARNWMTASGTSVFEHHQYYRLWTTLFAHADAGHLASNSFLFFILSYFLYGYFGGWVFPVAAFFLSGLSNILVLQGYPQEVELIGASGVVYWMGGAWLMLYFYLSRQKNMTQRILRTLGVGVLIFMPAEAFHQQVSYAAHFYGFITGICFGWLYFQLRKNQLRRAERYVFENDGPDLEALLKESSVADSSGDQSST